MKYYKESYHWSASYDFASYNISIDNHILWKTQFVGDEIEAWIYVPIDGCWQKCSELARIHDPDDADYFKEITEEEAFIELI